MFSCAPLSVALALFLMPAAWTQEAKVMNRVEADKLEAILKDLKIEYKKSPHEKSKNAVRYDFTRTNFKIRLINFNGEDLWIESIFNDKIGLEQVNAWNVEAKFSRCVLIPANDKDKKAAPSISLEAQLDCFGGVTEGMIRQFIGRFDGELKNFAKFLSK